MKYFLIIIFASISNSIIHAHDSNEAFFTIKETENILLVEAEFPWKLRHALFEYHPGLKNTADKDVFDQTFFDYVKASLILKDNNQNTIKLLEIKEGLHAGHSHQTNYEFHFEKAHLIEVFNSMMFNINEGQKNKHILELSTDSRTFTTTKKHPSYNLKQVSKKKYIWIIIPIIILNFIWLYWRKNN